MFRIIGKFIKGYKGNFPETKMILLGLDAAGKTTIIYKMKLGEVVTTIPTIGFNVETVEYKNLTIRCWDVGGCDKIRPIWRHYTQDMGAFIYVVDSNDRERIEDAASEFALFIQDFGTNVPVLLFANKQDLPNAMSVTEVVDKMRIANLKLQHFHAQASCATTGDGLFEGFDWLAMTLGGNVPSSSKSNSNSNSASTNSNSASASSSNTTASTQNGARPPPQPPFKSPSDTLSNNEFLKAFTEYTLPSWDHKTHIRIAYLNLKKYGRREGVKKIREGLQNFIANSSITNKNRYHETMTYFWLQMTHYALKSSDIPLTWTADDDENGLAAFDAFLEKNTQLMNGGLFLEYYSRELMLNNADSRQQFAVPDIKPLPNIVETNN